MSALVFAVVGQSNGVGLLGPVSQYTLTDTWVVGINGITRPLTEPAFMPTRQATDTPGGQVDHESTNQFPGQSQCSAMAFRLRQLGVTERLIFCPCALGGASATTWIAGLAQNPWTYTNLFPASIKVISQAMQAPNAQLGGIIVNQGESEASAGPPYTTDWPTHWGSVFNAYLTVATQQSWTWAKTKRFWIQKLQLASTLTYASSLRTLQQSLADARSDTVALQEPDSSPYDLHLQGGPQNALGILQANSWFAAT
jgi:hypothetical protein